MGILAFISSGREKPVSTIVLGIFMHRVRSRLGYLFPVRPFIIMFSPPQSGQGVIIVDAGGGTIDLSAYYMKQRSSAFEEIAPALCLPSD
jgi:hypothetical protein